jgi:iron-sulfur cluster repair protein YtfE (RIC family)
MSDITKLREDHAELVRLVRELGARIERPTPPPQLELFELRRQLTSTLIAHLKAEDWVLYPRLLASTDPAIAATARAFNDEMGGLAAAFSNYSETWNATAIAGDWAGYCEASRAIIEALTNRIVRENRELLPLLDRAA